MAKAIAASIGKPLVRFIPGQQLDLTTVLMVEDLDRVHLPLMRRLADRDEPMPFVIALTEQPWDHLHLVHWTRRRSTSARGG